MPLSSRDRRFLSVLSSLQMYLLLLAGMVLLYLLCTPPEKMNLAVCVLGVALSGVFWLTQRLMTLVSQLDFELTRLSNAVQESLPDESKRRLSS